MSNQRGWIGVDLDGTLAHYEPTKDFSIGKPIPRMVNRVNQWLAEGYEVKIFTARAGNRAGIEVTKAWLNKHGLPDLDVTNRKDFQMLFAVDDRAKQVIPNTGILLEETQTPVTELTNLTINKVS